jgi:choline dehydrogenase-like flavoprotein
MMDDDRRVIVIGSGPAGAVAALTLLRAGIPVTMLESGQRPPHGLLIRAMGHNVLRKRPGFASPKRHIASGDPNALWYHDLAPGGLSNHWTGAVPRFAPEDFCEGERLHERYRWPLSYEDLAPYYDQVERLLVVVGNPHDVPNLPACHVAFPRRLPMGWQPVARCAASFGQGLTTAPLADGNPWLVRRSGVAFDSYHGIVRGLRRFPHFQLILGAHVVRLEWSGSKQKVHAVTYVDRTSGAMQRVPAAAVVVAAGTLSSTKLLLDSACPDFPDGLGNTQGLLGRYLHDHAHGFCRLDLDRPLPRLGQAAYLTRASYQESAPLLAASCTIGNAGTARLEKVLSLAPTPTAHFSVITFGTIVPTSCNYVGVHPSLRDDLGLPLLDLHLRFGADVTQNMVKARERLLAVLEAAGYHGRVRDALAQLTPGSSVHYGGTVRMHQSPKYGMLDAWNRIHTVPNTIVVDASCFTTGVEKNPTPTVMALAARAAERLAVDLKTSGTDC